MAGQTFAGGCLCGGLRYEADGPPTLMGHCYCADCRKASGSGFIPFSGFKAYAGSLDDPAMFKPSVAILVRDQISWALIPPGLTIYEGLPGE